MDVDIRGGHADFGLGVVTFFVLGMLLRLELPPFLWPIAIPAVVPLLVLAFSYWALIPPLNAAIPARVAGGVVWGLVVLSCLAIFPLERSRDQANAGIAAAQARYDADLAKLRADAPLWDWVPFLQTRNAVKQDEVLGHIRRLARRQSDAELMLERGDFPLGFLSQIDLQPTPAICDKARALLRRQVVPLVPAAPNANPYTEVAQPVADAVSAMSWLVGHDCS